MNSRERVMRALRRDGLPDRVPLQFDLSRPLLEAFSQKLDIPIGWQPNYYEDLKYRTRATSCGWPWAATACWSAGRACRLSQPEQTDDGCIVNEFGMKMREGLAWYDVVEGPLERAGTVEEVRDLPFPDPADEARFVDARRYIDRYQGEYFIIGDVELTMFEMAWHMTGMEKFMIDMAMGEPYIEVLLDRIMEFSIGIGRRARRAGRGRHLDRGRLRRAERHDDLAATCGGGSSSRAWRRSSAEFKRRQPRRRGHVPLRRGHRAHPRRPDRDRPRGLQPGAAQRPGPRAAGAESQFGDRLSFWGAIDQQHLLPKGSPDEIDADVRAKIEALGSGGGYMVAPAHILQGDTPVENVEAFIAAVRRHGVYA